MLPLTGVTHVGTGSTHACAATAAGVSCWGSNQDGQLGDGTTVTSPNPVPVGVPLLGVSALALGGSHSCALAAGEVYCWGSNREGQAAGTGTRPTPTLVAGQTGATELAVGSRFSCSLHADQRMWCWGENNAGQLGYSGTNNPSPANLGLVGVTSIAAMGSTACATLASGIQCWGFGLGGALGDGGTTSRPTPSPVVQPTMAIGSIHSSSVGNTACATSGDTVHCWGTNDFRATGIDAAGNILVPTAVPSLSDVAAVRTGGTFSCALMDSGDVFCWGDNNQGQLGRGTFSSAGMPSAMPQRVMPPL